MQITGSTHLATDPATAWAAFHDAAVLERTLPGAQQVTETGPGRYAITVSAGVAAIKGTYEGHAAFDEEDEPHRFVLRLSGAGGPGTVDADVRVELQPSDEGGTALTWTADAVVGGPIGGVGQRMLSSVATRLATQFFANLERDILAGPDAGETSAGDPAEAAHRPGGSGPVAAGLTSATGVTTAGTLAPLLAGGAIALAGVVVGALLRRPRRTGGAM